MSILLNITHIKATGIFLVISEPTEFSKMPFLSLARTPFQRQGKSPISVSHCCLLKVPGSGDFPGGPVAETPHSQCREPRLDPWSGNTSGSQRGRRPRPWWAWGNGQGLRALDGESTFRRGSSARGPRAAPLSIPPSFQVSVGQVLAEMSDSLSKSFINSLTPLVGEEKKRLLRVGLGVRSLLT